MKRSRASKMNQLLKSADRALADDGSKADYALRGCQRRGVNALETTRTGINSGASEHRKTRYKIAPKLRQESL
jgi:ElaB/YqjD/DUF883 family membrane-anchored ribosome-binding protein